MPMLRLKLSDLQTLSAPTAESLASGHGDPASVADLETRIRNQSRSRSF